MSENKIHNPEAAIRALEYGGGLITYPNGMSRISDIDFMSQSADRFVFGETKKVYNSEVRLPWGQFWLYQELNKQLSSRIGYIIGYEDSSKTSPDDYLYAVTFDELRFKTIWREPDGVHIPLTSMSLLKRRDINNEANSFLNELPS